MNMPRFRAWSSVGKKLLNGFTGVLLLVFIVAHLAGNLTIFFGKNALNAYAATTHALGPILFAIELGLLVVILLHAVTAVAVWRDNRAGRESRYVVKRSKGASSKQTISSRTMIVTGAVLFAFLVIHLKQFRFGPAYSTPLPGHLGDVWDLYRVVVDVFRQPVWVIFYVVCMVLLGFHLRHGFWSAFQSIGALNPRLRPLAFSFGVAFALVIAAGFIALPIYVYFVAHGNPSGIAMLKP